MKKITTIVAVLCFSLVTQPTWAKSVKEASIAVFESTAKLGSTTFTEFNDDAAKIEEAKAAVLSVLKDPESAQFRNVFITTPTQGTAVCGEVNAKNSYGGFTGFQYFITGGLRGFGTTIEKPSSETGIYMMEWCLANEPKN
ncbi:hypothetical protein [Hwanghaeella sp. LZ110]|uniref:hypothetical protein n=1 Tax=Hwanghaeella sp. LZ110 TaxID=3402810 RepID=UPI003B67BCFB